MNLAHRLMCSSQTWKRTVETHIIPWVLEGLEMGSSVLEVGPGPGVTTELLQGRFEHLTCVEIDRGFARSLSKRMNGKNVIVVREDAAAMSFPASFDGALSFIMLHHVPSVRTACWRKWPESCGRVEYSLGWTASIAARSAYSTSSTPW